MTSPNAPKTRRRTAAIVLVAAALVAGCGDGGTAAPHSSAGTSPTIPAIVSTPSPTRPPGVTGATVDGAKTVSGKLDGPVRQSHDLVVPRGVTATVTVTPDAREDVIINYDGLTFNDALFGEPEIVQVTGPKRLDFRVYSFFKNGFGRYSITVTS